MNTAHNDPNVPLLESARTLISEVKLQEAASILNQARTQIPQDPRVYMMAGLMTEKSGNLEGALKLMHVGISIAPQWGPGYIELAQLHARHGKTSEAIEMAENALRLDSRARVILEGASNVGHLTGHTEFAIKNLRKALSLYPNDEKIQVQLATSLHTKRSWHDALLVWNDVVAAYPISSSALTGRMYTHLALGDMEAALLDAQALLALDPENDLYQYYAARASGATPDRQPPELSRTIFDAGAQTFDQQLVNKLHYQLPQQVAQQIRKKHPSLKIRVLDLGCGTGLLAKHLGKVQGSFVGVDISIKMLEQARRLNVYDRLLESDLQEVLCNTASEDYDVITALEVLLYTGNPELMIQESARLLKVGGMLVLSCEEAQEQGPDFVLSSLTERYQHKLSYMEGLCRSAGFPSVQTRRTILRKDHGEDIHGFVITAQKAS